MKFKTPACSLFFAAFLFLQNVFAQPSVSFFTPATGAIGSSVTITGTNFGASPAANIVFFGAVKAVVNTASATTLTVTVPNGATYQPITVTVNNLTAYSAKPFIVTFAGGGTAFTAGSFDGKVDLTAGDQPAGLAIGDLDGDGKADLAVTNANAATVSVFRNTGTSGTVSFAAKADYATATNPQFVSIGDIDGDGKPDLAVANEGSSNVSIFKNTSSAGNISFAPKADFDTRKQPNCVSIGDLDGDGKPDLAVANGETIISLLRNTSTAGTISFASKTDFISGTGPWRIAIQDLDADNKPELAVAGNGTVSIFRNTCTPGVLSFAAKVDFTTNTGYGTISTGDFDGDGKPDLAVANAKDPNKGTVSILKNTSTTGNISFAGKVDYTSESGATSICSSDLDGDGKPDLAVTNTGLPSVSVFRNSGTSGTVSFETKIGYATGSSPISVAAGDLDGDGEPDLAVADSVSNTVSILRGMVADVLPVTLVNFSGRLAGNQIQLQWQTASEQNSAGFTVEYAADGVTFSSIGTIKAAGNSNSMKSYSFIHSKPKNGSNFYRLRIINTDAKTSISKTISVNLSNINTMLSVYPNPAKEYMVVDHPATANDARLTLVDMNGRMIKTIKVIKDAVQTTINIKSVLPGSYKIVWNDGITTRNQTVVVK